MAQYKETVYASDSWAENYVNGDLSGVTRAAVLSSQENFSFTYENSLTFSMRPANLGSGSGTQHFPIPKEKAGAGTAIRLCDGTSSSSSGNIKSGRFVFGYGDFISDLFDVGADRLPAGRAGGFAKKISMPQ